MAVISMFKVNEKQITKNNNSIVSNINIGESDYNFANRDDLKGIGSVVCDNSVKEPIYDMQVYGNSIQDGTPTSENPIEIESVGVYDETTGKYKIPIKVSDGTEERTTNIYLDEPLRKIGDYIDYVDYKNKKVVRYVDKYVFKGTESISLRGQQPTNGTAVFTAAMFAYRENFENLICTRFSADRNYASNMTPNTCCFVNSSVDSRFHFCLEGAGKTVDEVKAILKEWYDNGNPMVVLYPPNKAIPEETIEIPTIETFKGTNAVSIETNTTPSKTSVEYWRQIGVENKQYVTSFSSGVTVKANNTPIASGTELERGTDVMVGYTLTSGYTLEKFTIYGENSPNNSVVTITRPLEVEFKENIYYTISFNKGVTVTKDGVSISSGTKVPNGTVLVIGYNLSDNHELVSFKINGIEVPNNSTFTVSGSTNIVFVEEIKKYSVTFNNGVTVKAGDVSLTSGDLVAHGTSIVVGYTLTDGYKLTSFTVNGVETENNSTITVTGDIEIVFAEEQEVSDGAIYGVSWVNDASTTMTRTDDAVNMTYSIDTSTGKVTSDFNNVFPYNQMKRHVINGNTFVYVPEMWFRVVADSDQKITSLAVSKVKGDGDNWYKTRPFYYGAYGASSDGTVLKSVSSATMISSLTKIQARQRAVSVGAGYHLKDLYSLTILMFLWWIEFGTKNWRDVFSFNTTNTKTGNTDSFYNETIGDGLFVTGYNTSTKNFVWHGIEDFFGAHTEHIDGVTGNQVNNGTIYASDNYSIYDYYNNGSQMPALSYTFTTTNTNYSCVKSYGWDKNNPFLCLPIETLYDNNSKSGFCIFRFEGNDQDWAFGIYTTGYSNVTAFYESFSNTISGTTLGERLVLNA